MATTQCIVVARETQGGVETRPDEMLHSALDCELEDPDSPVCFGFLANGETVQIYEDVRYVFEC